MRNMDFRSYFKGKKITVIGLGLLGGVGDIEYLARAGADLIVTDLKSKKELKPSLDRLKKFKNIKYTLGIHSVADFRNRDLIIKAPSTPLDSPYIALAEKRKIPVTMWAALFSKFARQVGAKIVGVTGTRGKTTTTEMINAILVAAKKKVVVGGNVQGTSVLANLSKLTRDTIVLLELDSWKLQGFGDLKLSPNVAVFTTFYEDHLNYYNSDVKKYFLDKANIFKYQKKGDILIAGKQVLPFIKKWGGKHHGKLITPKQKIFNLSIPGEHNLYNANLAAEAARRVGVKELVIEKALNNFQGVPGRLEFVKEVRGVKYYNDTTATTPEATSAALRALGDQSRKRIILIAGGSDKNLQLGNLAKDIKKYAKEVVLIPGDGTDRLVQKLKVRSYKGKNLKDIVHKAKSLAGAGDIVLFSPAFTSFGMFQNEYDRGDKFITILKKLK